MFRPLEAIIRSRFGYPGGGIKFKLAKVQVGVDGGSRSRSPQMGTLANVVGKVECNLRFTNLGLCI